MIQKVNYKNTYYLYYGVESYEDRANEWRGRVESYDQTHLIVLYRIEQMNGEDVTSFVDRHDWDKFTAWIESGGAN